jgi:hypothetical protein
MIEVILESLYDTTKTFFFILVFYIVFSFIEMFLVKRLASKNKTSVLFGAVVGLIPQCGVSVVGSDLYLKRHISVGTLLAIFLTCSDEALPLLFTSGSDNLIAALMLVLLKFSIGFTIGYFADMIITKKEVHEHLLDCNHEDINVHVGCCNHHIDDEEEDGFDRHIWHPFLHSLKLAIYILVINVVIGALVYWLGEETLGKFLEINRYVAPLFALIIGLIPNCASSVILAELYIVGTLSFGALLSGLLVNAGLGMIFLLKGNIKMKEKIGILTSLIFTSLVSGYILCIILGF